MSDRDFGEGLQERDEPAVPRAPYRDAERGSTALLLIDMINPLEFARGAEIVEPAQDAAEVVHRLREDASAAGVPVIYVNDNFGEWHSEASRLVDRAVAEGSTGRHIADRLRPRPEDYFIIKPQFSGFYATNLPVLLPKLGVSRLILAGMAADICVLFTAADAHMRDYELWVPEDAVVAQTRERKTWALQIMEHSMGAEVRPVSDLTLAEWLDESRDDREPKDGPEG